MILIIYEYLNDFQRYSCYFCILSMLWSPGPAIDERRLPSVPLPQGPMCICLYESIFICFTKIILCFLQVIVLLASSNIKIYTSESVYLIIIHEIVIITSKDVFFIYFSINLSDIIVRYLMCIDKNCFYVSSFYSYLWCLMIWLNFPRMTN